jgi:hypothetical protein
MVKGTGCAGDVLSARIVQTKTATQPDNLEKVMDGLLLAGLLNGEVMRGKSTGSQ